MYQEANSCIIIQPTAVPLSLRSLMAVTAIIVDKLVFCTESKGLLSIILLCTNFIQIVLLYWALDILIILSVPRTNPLGIYLFAVI
jgi:hypothetical protein